jgi:hypothetical protein
VVVVAAVVDGWSEDGGETSGDNSYLELYE